MSLCTARLPGSPDFIETGHRLVVVVLLRYPEHPTESLLASLRGSRHGSGRTAQTDDTWSGVKPLNKRAGLSNCWQLRVSRLSFYQSDDFYLVVALLNRCEKPPN